MMRAALAAAKARSLKPAILPSDRAVQLAYAREVARLAVRSLYEELCLYPKPGLVSLVDAGSHDDMDAVTFMRSLFSLRHYFKKICLAGWDDAPFAQLKQLGIAAEAAMLKATRGINTHRGAIFSLGMLCATAGRARAQGTPTTPSALRAAMLIRWGEELAMHAAPTIALPVAAAAPAPAPDRAPVHVLPPDADADAPNPVPVPAPNPVPAPAAYALTEATPALSNGLLVAARYAASGAREEGALGLPSVFEIGVPALLASRARGAGMSHARIDTLFALMAHISDSNVYHRAGRQGAQTVRAHAQRFIDNGGTASATWHADALESHHAFVKQRLSPGGAADLLAASCLVHAIATLK